MMDFKISTPVMSGDNVVDIKRLYDAFLQQKKAMEFLVNTIDNDLTAKGLQIDGDSVQIGTNASNILVNAQWISLNVSDISSNTASILLNAQEIVLQATDIQNNSSSITVNSNNIELKVSSDEIISKINLSTEGIQIDASKVNITGFVTFANLSTSGETTINGSNITTGTISASLLTTDLAQVNDTLYIGNQTDSGLTKQILFETGAKITAGSNGVAPWIDISAEYLEFMVAHITCNGSWDFSTATVSGITAVFG